MPAVFYRSAHRVSMRRMRAAFGLSVALSRRLTQRVRCRCCHPDVGALCRFRRSCTVLTAAERERPILRAAESFRGFLPFPLTYGGWRAETVLREDAIRPGSRRCRRRVPGGLRRWSRPASWRLRRFVDGAVSIGCGAGRGRWVGRASASYRNVPGIAVPSSTPRR